MQKNILLLTSILFLTLASCNTKKEKEQEATDTSSMVIESLRQALTQSHHE